MIFSNEGMTQVGGDPFENMLELAHILRTMNLRAHDIGMPDDVMNNIIVLAGKLSMVDEDMEHAFLDSLPVGGVEISEIMRRFDIFMKHNQ